MPSRGKDPLYGEAAIPDRTTTHRSFGRGVYALVTLFALAVVLLPFLFWYDTWFGRRLSERQIETYLNDAAKPRRAQHALVQIGERLARGDRSVARWYPKLTELAQSPVPELRQTTAWIMGQDSGYEPFHGRLLALLSDPSVLVRRNAALALAAWGDPSARAELQRMLRPYRVASPATGPVEYRVKPGRHVGAGTLLARVGGSEVRSPVPGEVRALLKREGEQVNSGETLAEILPEENHAWEALRALFLVGNAEDVDDVRRYAQGVPGMPERLQQQAALTLRAIQNRSRQ